MCAAVQIKEGKWFARDGKTKRKSSQYFEVRAPFLLVQSAPSYSKSFSLHAQVLGCMCGSGRLHS